MQFLSNCKNCNSQNYVYIRGKQTRIFGEKLTSMVIVGIVYVEAKDSQSTISFYRKSIFLSDQVKAASHRFLQIWKGTNIRILCSSLLMSSQFFLDYSYLETLSIYTRHVRSFLLYGCTLILI